MWTRMRVVALLILAGACRPAGPPAAGGGGTTWLKGDSGQQLATVEKQLRGLDVAMAEIGHRFGELHWAGEDRNWDYAKYQADKIRLVLELALERRPKRATSAQPFLKEDLPAMMQAIETKDPARYREGLERLRTGCMKCHVAESVPYFTVQFPEHRVSVIRKSE
jgi:hypothetical protein